MYVTLFKPAFDFMAALILLIILSPILIVVVLLLGVANKGKVFFIQERPGKDERIFKLIKFKTMNDDRDENGNLAADDKRLTRIGEIVRKTSLDELPQMINIIKGDMSFIGPRPWLVEYLPLYSGQQRKRHHVKPGITGWAQVNGRNLVSWERRFEYDLYYVSHISFWLDIKIIILTIYNIFTARGISGEGVVTMEKFKGNK